LSFSGSLTAWLYTCCRMCRRSPRDGCLFSLWAGSDVPFSYNKVNNDLHSNIFLNMWRSFPLATLWSAACTYFSKAMSTPHHIIFKV
jgi:hypothetical protein